MYWNRSSRTQRLRGGLQGCPARARSECIRPETLAVSFSPKLLLQSARKSTVVKNSRTSGLKVKSRRE